MANFTPDTFAEHLTRTFASRTPHGMPPRVVADTDEKGRPVLEFTLPNPHDARHSVSLTASTYKGAVSLCALWFGQVEITAALNPADAVPAIEEILAGNIVACARYKSRDAYDARRKASSGTARWVYQLPDDAEQLAAMTRKLAEKANPWERFVGSMTGVFEVYAWASTEVFER